jgi:hypothetical protein
MKKTSFQRDELRTIVISSGGEEGFEIAKIAKIAGIAKIEPRSTSLLTLRIAIPILMISCANPGRPSRSPASTMSFTLSLSVYISACISVYQWQAFVIAAHWPSVPLTHLYHWIFKFARLAIDLYRPQVIEFRSFPACS